MAKNRFKKDHRDLIDAYQILQSLMYATEDKKARNRVAKAMCNINEVMMQMRRAEIFTAGAKIKGKCPKPKLYGRELSSTESYTFYEGYESTHPGWVHPYKGHLR
jgi:hypothetical protein